MVSPTVCATLSTPPKIEVPCAADGDLRRYWSDDDEPRIVEKSFIGQCCVTFPRKPCPQTASSRPFAPIFGEYGTALCNAAGLIDGEAGTALVLRLMSDLRETTRLNRAVRRRLVDLHRFLSLDPVVDGFEPDLSAWVLLDPGSPEVEQICLLTDQLYDLLIEIGALDEEEHAQAVVLQAHGVA